jgi:hypothetical protein
LDEGKRPRYNSRDACWWFVRAIGEYIDATKDYGILKSKVDMIFLSNDIFEHNRLKSEGKNRVLALEDVTQGLRQSLRPGFITERLMCFVFKVANHLFALNCLKYIVLINQLSIFLMNSLLLICNALQAF